VGELFEFSQAGEQHIKALTTKPWNIMVVDDDTAVHDITTIVLEKLVFDDRPVKLTHGYSAKHARELLEDGNEYAVILLDVVMETNHAGLDLVNYIRHVKKDLFLRIILRTGQPGQAPESSVIVDYDINDYKEKTELTADKMRSCIMMAMRSYRDIIKIQELALLREKLQEQVILRNKQLEEKNNQLVNEVQERLFVEQKLNYTNEKLESIINNSNALISLKDLDGNYDLVNDAFLNTLSFNCNSIIGKSDTEIFSRDIATIIHSNDKKVLLNREAIQCEELLPNKDGEHFYLCVKFPLYDDNGDIYRICSIATDITDRLEAQNEISRLSQYDMLTELPNRSLFIDRITQAIARHDKNNHAVLFINIDRFKVINETLGHDIGDSLLKDIAKRLLFIIREGDSVCRLGGDEFAILLNHLSNEHDVARIAKKIIAELSKTYLIKQKEIIVTASIGISRYPIDGVSVQALLKKADLAMYKAKQAGKNTYRFCLKEDDIKTSGLLALEVDMRKMLASTQNQLYLLYQPKVTLSDGGFSSVEALIRWQHPERGFISPVDFIPLMEETGLILDVDEWVLKEACRFAYRAEKSGHPIKVAINLSSKQFITDNLIPILKKVLNETKCSPQYIELEVTESSLINDFEKTKIILDQISAMGISLAIDDFGTGYSSMNYLKRLPFNTLKIDRSFIIDAANKAQDKAIVTTITQLAHNLNMSVVAEGVETVAQYKLLKDLISTSDDSKIQGFIFSKPLTEKELIIASEEISQKWLDVEND
jgi:diguanylate cyclase (GGDEF)-like protein/PAS domain S-box-containing protein